MEKKILSLVLVLASLVMVSCGSKMNEPYIDSYCTWVDIFDTINYVNQIKNPKEMIEGYESSEDKILHIKYENNTLWLYYDLSDIKKYENVAYKDIDDIGVDTISGLVISEIPTRVFYNKSTHHTILYAVQKVNIVVDMDKDIKESWENKEKRWCGYGNDFPTTIEGVIKKVETNKNKYIKD